MQIQRMVPGEPKPPTFGWKIDSQIIKHGQFTDRITHYMPDSKYRLIVSDTFVNGKPRTKIKELYNGDKVIAMKVIEFINGVKDKVIRLI